MEGRDEIIVLNTCRRCPNRQIPYLTYTPTGVRNTLSQTSPPENDIKIMIGIPPKGFSYKAISHVWGDVKPLTMHCRGCSGDSIIELKSKHTFENIMSLAGPGSALWMDNISIDQEDDEDVKKQVAAMGTIYENAEVVAVMLPPGDVEVYEQLSEMIDVCGTILRHREYFEREEQCGPRDDEPYPMISNSVQKFFAIVDSLREATGKAKYWSRAWTFQEWALARDVDIGVESERPGDRATLHHVKSVVIDVATMVVSYKLRYAAYAGVDVGFSRGHGPAMLDRVKRLFPNETRFLSETERNRQEARTQMHFTSFGGNEQLLGLRGQLPTAVRQTPEELFHARLSTMLNTFRGGKDRQATFEADMVACWASMCDIDYDYKKLDKLPVAIAKVTRALRQRGLKVYNFQSLGATSPDADPDFFRYSYVHVKTNSEQDQEAIFGIPFMTGHMDTCIHLLGSLRTDPDEWLLPKETRAGGFRVAKVKESHLAIEFLHNTKDSLVIFSAATSGRPDITHSDVVGKITNILRQIPDEVLKRHVVIGAAIPVAPGSDQSFAAWTVVTAAILFQVLNDEWNLFIGREGLNGTLVVAANRKTGGPEATVVLGYLAITDHSCGSFLVPSTAGGQVLIVLDDTGGNASLMDTTNIGKRALEAKVELEDVGTEDSRPAAAKFEEALFVLRPGNNQTVVRQLESAEQRRSDLGGHLGRLVREKLESGEWRV